MKARSRKPKRSRAKSPLFVIGAVIGTIPTLHASDHRQLALPVERRITLEPRRLEAALAHIKIWTPSETLPLFYWQDVSGPPGPAPGGRPTQPRTFAIPPGSLGDGAQDVRDADRRVRHALGGRHSRRCHRPASPGLRTVEQALSALLTGTGVSYRFTNPPR